MSDSLDIHSLLQAGYFTSSRAKNAGPPSPRPEAQSLSSSIPSRETCVPRSYDLVPRSRPSYPPHPSVEDEAESLAREYGVSGVIDRADEEPQSRGDIDQHPIILEVHEHNPERRFVILNDVPKSPTSGPHSKLEESQPLPSPAPDIKGSFKTQPDSRDQSAPHKEHVRADSARPVLQSRRSRQDLPRIETDLRQHRSPEHHRSKSSASAVRPDYFSPRQPRPYGDQMLSPEVRSSGFGGRDKAYRGLGQSPTSGVRSSRRQSYYDPGGRKRDDDDCYYKNERSTSTARRSGSSAESSKPSRRQSNDWIRDPRYRKDASATRDVARGSSKPYARGEGDVPNKSPQASREHSRSTDGMLRDAGGFYAQKKPLIFQDHHPATAPAVHRSEDSPERPRPYSRLSAVAIPSPSQASFAATAATAAAPMSPRSLATLPMADGDGSRPSDARTSLPYPDDDDFGYHGLGIIDGHVVPAMAACIPIPAVSMPEPSPAISDRPVDFTKATPPAETPKEAARAWQPPSFDPERDGLQVNNNKRVGSYRRYSESKDKAGSEGLPECPRTNPVVGMVDWLTLPRTDFNICPTCYETVFAKSEFRTHFQPILRPTGGAFACDFGSSAWYRIAWLLTLKREQSDLWLLHQVANIASSSRDDERCPGNRKTTRGWLTIKDPYTRLPVPEFSVCHQCARTVEALLPNLTGVFTPLEPRSEPTRDVCALHFTAKRKQFVLYFDALETVSDKACMNNKAPNVSGLAKELQKLSIGRECLEDSPVLDGYWHIMQFLPQFTVCGTCFSEVVQPKIDDGSSLAQNFYMKPQKLPSATCQLYSARMRDIFSKACRRKDPGYLKDRVLERRDMEANIYDKLLQLDKSKRSDAWTEEQVEKLVREWRRWE